MTQSEKIIEPFFTKVVVVCSAKLVTTFFFLSNDSGNVITLKVTVFHH